MEILQAAVALLYILGCVFTAVAADQRTAGPGLGFVMALFCTPLVGAVLILAYPKREEAAHYYRMKKKADAEKAAQ